jgi:hypothetical protein
VTDYAMPLVLAEFFDLHGHRVTAVTAGLRGEQVAIITARADEGDADGQPFMNGDHCRKLGAALLAFADRDLPS